MSILIFVATFVAVFGSTFALICLKKTINSILDQCKKICKPHIAIFIYNILMLITCFSMSVEKYTINAIKFMHDNKNNLSYLYKIITQIINPKFFVYNENKEDVTIIFNLICLLLSNEDGCINTTVIKKIFSDHTIFYIHKIDIKNGCYIVVRINIGGNLTSTLQLFDVKLNYMLREEQNILFNSLDLPELLDETLNC